MKKQYGNSVIGGTFDHLHAGHGVLIDRAINNSERTFIGITSDVYPSKKPLSQLIEKYTERENNLKSYIASRNKNTKTDIFMISDYIGNCLKVKDLEAIFVTDPTENNALLINEKRVQNGLKPMRIEKVEMVKADDWGVITSERIRRGEINKEGVSFLKPFIKDLFLTRELRNKLRQPLGHVVEGSRADSNQAEKIFKYISSINPFITITVGDVITDMFIKNGYIPDMAVVDNKTRRSRYIRTGVAQGFNTISVDNQPSTINAESVNAISEGFKRIIDGKQRQLIEVNGEEDLLALPSIILAPLNSIVVYGQYGRGGVVVSSTLKEKEQLLSLVSGFSI